MIIDIFKDGIGYVTDYVSSVEASEVNLSHENRVTFVTDLAIVSRGLNPQEYYSGTPEENFKKREKLFKRLMKEAAPNTVEDAKKGLNASRPMEFCGVGIESGLSRHAKIGKFIEEMSADDFGNCWVRYIHTTENAGQLHTNLRALLNAGLPYDDIPFGDSEGFFAIKAKVPMWLWAQIMTHTALSKESQSDRISSEKDYWLPDELEERLKHADLNGKLDKFWEEFPNTSFTALRKSFTPFRERFIYWMLNEAPQNTVQGLLRHLGYHQEIWSRAPYYFKYKVFVMTGWTQDPTTWEHLLLERAAVPEVLDNWTQSYTKQFVQAVRQLVEPLLPSLSNIKEKND